MDKLRPWPMAKTPRVEPMWEDLGLEEMLSEVSSLERSEPSSTTVPEAEDTERASTSSEGSEGGRFIVRLQYGWLTPRGAEVECMSDRLEEVLH